MGFSSSVVGIEFRRVGSLSVRVTLGTPGTRQSICGEPVKGSMALLTNSHRKGESVPGFMN